MLFCTSLDHQISPPAEREGRGALWAGLPGRSWRPRAAFVGRGPGPSRRPIPEHPREVLLGRRGRLGRGGGRDARVQRGSHRPPPAADAADVCPLCPTVCLCGGLGRDGTGRKGCGPRRLLNDGSRRYRLRLFCLRFV